MKCPVCSGASYVINKRLRARYNVVYRRRECRVCGHRFASYEGDVRPCLRRQITKEMKVARANREKRRARVYAAQIARETGLKPSTLRLLRSVAREEAARTGKDVMTLYAKAGALTPREKALLASDSRPTVGLQ